MRCAGNGADLEALVPLGSCRRGDPTLLRRSRRSLASWLAVALLLVAGCGAQPRPLEPPRGIVLIVLDTLRADGLSAYGNPRDTSPAIDSLATRGVLFENAMSHARGRCRASSVC
jgi:hypothetical protein